jgi:hypothetical protein
MWNPQIQAFKAFKRIAFIRTHIRDPSVKKVTGFKLDGRDLNSCGSLESFLVTDVSRLALGPTSTHIQSIPAALSGSIAAGQCSLPLTSICIEIKQGFLLPPTYNTPLQVFIAWFLEMGVRGGANLLNYT